jgi:GNAT superfamily N-acetyltransferase
MKSVNRQAILRQAQRSDIAAIQRVRASVRENRLVSRHIGDDEVQRHLEVLGRGWVIEVEQRSPDRPPTGARSDPAPAGNRRSRTDREVVAFAIADATIGHVWALFVDPRYERHGFGRRLHDVMVDWLWSQGLQHLWLSTEAGTRAERFYRAAGWRDAGKTPHGELAFVLDRPSGAD